MSKGGRQVTERGAGEVAPSGRGERGDKWAGPTAPPAQRRERASGSVNSAGLALRAGCARRLMEIQCRFRKIGRRAPVALSGAHCGRPQLDRDRGRRVRAGRVSHGELKFQTHARHAKFQARPSSVCVCVCGAPAKLALVGAKGPLKWRTKTCKTATATRSIRSRLANTAEDAKQTTI